MIVEGTYLIASPELDETSVPGTVAVTENSVDYSGTGTMHG